MNMKIIQLMCLSFFVASPLFASEAKLYPFVLASVSQQGIEETLTTVQAALNEASFEIVGQARPYDGVVVLVVTNDALKTMATASKNGGFGAMARVSLTQVDEGVQVAYTNPEYWFHIYQMEGDILPVKSALMKALGETENFGPSHGLTAKALRSYHYKVFMPYFEDVEQLASYESHQEALDAVQAALAAQAGGVSKVYQIDLPGAEESVFGVQMTQKVSSDQFIMSEVDFKPIRSSAHLPYEFLVSGSKVITLSAKFRIAASFPDLSMMGDNSFMNIMDAPDDIKNALSAAAGNPPK